MGLYPITEGYRGNGGIRDMSFKNDKQLQEAFLDGYAKTGNISKVAQELGTSRQPIYSLARRDRGFKERMENARAEFMKETAESFKSHVPEAVEALLSVLRDENAPRTAVVQAAGKIIDYSKDFSEAADIEEKISQLQADIAEAEGRLA